MEGTSEMSPVHHLSPRAAEERSRTHRGRGRLAKATAAAGTTIMLALPIYPQHASASPLKPSLTSAALVSPQAGHHAATDDAHKLPRITGTFVTTASPTALPQPQAPASSSADTTWGIRTPVFAASLSALIGAAAGTVTTALLFLRGRRHTLIDRAEDHQRQDARDAQDRAEAAREQRRIAARDSWKRLYDDLDKDLADALTVYIDARRQLLCQDDAAAQLISQVLRRLDLAIELANGKRSAEFTASLTTLHDCLHSLQAVLLPERTSLTDPSTLNHTALMELLDRTTKQTLTRTELGRLVHDAQNAVNTEWGSPTAS